MKTKDERIIKHAQETGTPIFVFSAKDELAISALNKYLEDCTNAGCESEHIEGIKDRIYEFKKFRFENPQKTKKPD